MKFFDYNLPIFENNIASSPLIRFSGAQQAANIQETFPNGTITRPFGDSFAYNNSPLNKSEAEIIKAVNSNQRIQEILNEIENLDGEV